MVGQRTQTKLELMMLFKGHLQAMDVVVDENTRPIPLQEHVEMLVGATVYWPLQVLQLALAPDPTTIFEESMQLHVPELGSQNRLVETHLHIDEFTFFWRYALGFSHQTQVYTLRPCKI
jgi:hypothetical protein